jgi:hypothetical protein
VSKPLTDDELIYICQTSNNANTNRVLVRSISGVYYNESVYQPQLYANPFDDYNNESPLSSHNSGWPYPSNNTWPSNYQYKDTINRIEGISLHDPPTPRFDNTDDRKSTQSSDADEDMFGERPSVEKLYKNIDRYLPGHDLDKEIIVQPTVDQQQPHVAGKRPLGYRQSVRIVAKQAHNRWKQAVKIIQMNQVLRRKSTKMWDRKVERVKPGDEVSIASPDKPRKSFIFILLYKSPT